MARGSEPPAPPPSPPRRARWCLGASWLRQPDHKARAGDGGLAIRALPADTVLGPDTPAMRLDDLLGDREPEAGVLAKTLMRPVGVEALEHALQRVGADAGAVVVDHDLDLGAHAAAEDAHLAAGFGEGLRIGQKIRDPLAEPRIMAGHGEAVARAATLEADFDRDVVAE